MKKSEPVMINKVDFDFWVGIAFLLLLVVFVISTSIYMHSTSSRLERIEQTLIEISAGQTDLDMRHDMTLDAVMEAISEASGKPLQTREAWLEKTGHEPKVAEKNEP